METRFNNDMGTIPDNGKRVIIIRKVNKEKGKGIKCMY